MGLALASPCNGEKSVDGDDATRLQVLVVPVAVVDSFTAGSEAMVIVGCRRRTIPAKVQVLVPVARVDWWDNDLVPAGILPADKKGVPVATLDNDRNMSNRQLSNKLVNK